MELYKQRTAFGVIQQLHCDISVLLDSVPYLLHSILIRLWPLQKSTKVTSISSLTSVMIQQKCAQVC